MADDDETPVSPDLLRVSRRKYDRKLARLEAIDDKAMQTSRTAILVLGFVSSAVVVGGPSAAGEINAVSIAAGILGVVGVFAAAFIAIGTYTATIVPEETSTALLNDPAPDHDAFRIQLLVNVKSALGAIEREIDRNRTYLTASHTALLLGTFSLSLAAATLITVRSFDWESTRLTTLVAVGVGAILTAQRLWRR